MDNRAFFCNILLETFAVTDISLAKRIEFFAKTR